MRKKIIFVFLAAALLAIGCARPPAAKPAEQAAAPVPQFTVYQSVAGAGERQYQAQAGETALALLQSSHRVDSKSYAGMGEFVSGIDGVSPDAQHFWAFYVNGRSSNVGAGSYQLHSGDRINWQLEDIAAGQ
ncbi:MAG TPA: DUF4430 domain-containing protein [Patescibacteria group bacterium]|nr:DUF4430 domain-containing protein [Patescibacteria group bacterium]